MLATGRSQVKRGDPVPGGDRLGPADDAPATVGTLQYAAIVSILLATWKVGPANVGRLDRIGKPNIGGADDEDADR